jgi:hypothetical protein
MHIPVWSKEHNTRYTLSPIVSLVHDPQYIPSTRSLSLPCLLLFALWATQTKKRDRERERERERREGEKE